MLSSPHSSRSLYLVLLPALMLPPTISLAQAPAATPQQPDSAPQSTAPAKPEQSAAPTVLHTNANLVLVDVVVTDRSYPVHGLNKTSFHVLEDGHEQTIASFDEHNPAKPAAPAASQAPLPPHTFTNVPTYPDTQTVNVLLLDGLNTLLPDQLRVRHQMLDYMSSIQPGTPMAIFTLSSRLRMVKGFTSNPAELASALASHKTTPQNSVILDPGTSDQLDSSVGDLASFGADSNALANMQQFIADLTSFQTDQRVRITLDAMQQLARYLSGIPGRKNVIWFSGSFPISIDPDATLQNSTEAMRNYYDDVRETSQLLAAARVAVYPVDARGLMTMPSVDASKASASTNLVSGASNGGRGGSRQALTSNKSSYSRDDSNFLQQNMAEHASMQQIAEETGGQEFVNTNGLKEAVAKVVDNGASYYTIGYVPADRADDGKLHKIQVRTDPNHYKLGYRRGYYSDPPDKPTSHTPGVTSLVTAAMMPGAPPATQIWFTARALPATDPLFKDLKLSSQPAGESAATLKGPLLRYIVDLKVDAHWLSFQPIPTGAHNAAVEFLLVAYDSNSHKVNYVDKAFQISIKPEQYFGVMASGIPARLAIDLPPGEIALRIAVRDLAAGTAGSLEIALAVAAN